MPQGIGGGNMTSIDAMDGRPQIEVDMAIIKENIDEFFMLTCSFIIFFMQTGFALLEAGSVRSKNTTNILMKNTLDLLIGGICYWACGNAFAFTNGNAFIGLERFFSIGIEMSHYSKWLYGFCFTSTATTIVSGAVAERCSFVGYLIYTCTISGLVYPVVAHWIWGPGGWLVNTPFKDFSGSAVVHMTGGSAAFISCIVLGPRIGLYDKNGVRRPILGHSTPLASLGCFILLFGFLAFNASSSGSMSKLGDGSRTSKAVANTVLSGSASGLTALFVHRLGLFVNEGRERATWSFLLVVNGAFVGMVSICAGCDSYAPWASALVGMGAGTAFLFVRFLTWKSKYIDDPLDTIAVHFTGSWWGMIASGLFTANGLIAGNPMVLAWNVLGGLCISAWSMTMIGTCFGIMRYFKIHRVSAEQEISGIDVSKHNEPAYPVEAWIDDHCFLNGTIVGDEKDKCKTEAGGGVPGLPGFEMQEASATRYPMYSVVNPENINDVPSGRRISIHSCSYVRSLSQAINSASRRSSLAGAAHGNYGH